jgi:hypothetical protein
MFYLWTCGSVKSSNHKNIVSANCKFASVKFAEGQQIYQIFKSENLQICDLLNLFEEHPPLMDIESFLSKICIYSKLYRRSSAASKSRI